MESKKKKINIDKIKEKLMDLFLTDEGKRIVKEHQNLPEEEKKKLKKQRKSCIFAVLVILIINGIGLYFQNLKHDNVTTQENITVSTEHKTKTLNEPRTISSEELTKYMVDDLNNIYVKIAYTKLGNNVAYSVTYNYDIIPQGELSYTKYFTKGDLTSIFINGYPYLSYQEMGLKSEEEAYIATQLAIYEVISRKKLDDISNGVFSLNMISASQEQYEDMVERVLKKAKELADYAMENVYNTNANASVDLDNLKFDHVSDTETIIGPIYIHSKNDEYVKKIYGEDLKEYSDIELKNFFEYNTCTVLDKDMKEITQVNSEDPFYIKVNGPSDYFVQARVSTNLKKLYTKLYESDNSKKQYIILDSRDLIIRSIKSIIGSKVDYGNVYINFVNNEGEEVKNVKYYIYNEQGEILQDIDGFSKNGSSISLPVGKYYIQQYDTPSGYIVNQTKYEINITKDKEMIELNIPNDSIDLLIKSY